MGELVWYKSLYWRIAFGFVATLATLLLAQGGVLLWLTDRIVGSSWRTPEQLVAAVATDLSSAITADRSLDLDAYARDHFRHIYRPFLIVMRDGRVASNRMNGLPPGYIRAAQLRVRRGLPMTGTDWRDGGGAAGRAVGDFDGPGRGGRGERGTRSTAANGRARPTARRRPPDQGPDLDRRRRPGRRGRTAAPLSPRSSSTTPRSASPSCRWRRRRCSSPSASSARR